MKDAKKDKNERKRDSIYFYIEDEKLQKEVLFVYQKMNNCEQNLRYSRMLRIKTTIISVTLAICIHIFVNDYNLLKYAPLSAQCIFTIITLFLDKNNLDESKDAYMCASEECKKELDKIQKIIHSVYDRQRMEQKKNKRKR